MAEYDDIIHFRKAGLQRLRDAEELLQPPSLAPYVSEAGTRHLRGAMYLAGYSIEFVLKEYIISHTPPARSLGKALEIREANGKSTFDLYSSAGHNLTGLLALTDLEPAVISDQKYKRHWSVCLRWKSTWRYDSDVPTREQAQEFVTAVRVMYEWIKQRV